MAKAKGDEADPNLGAQLDALVIGQAQQEISSQLAMLSDLDAKLAGVTAGTLVLVPLLVNITFPIGLALAVPLTFSAGWSTWGLFSGKFQIGPDLSGFLDPSADQGEPEFRGRLRTALLKAVGTNNDKTERKTKAFNGSGTLFLGAGAAAALLFAVQVAAGQKLPRGLKAASDWWLANAPAVAVAVVVLSVCLILGTWFPRQLGHAVDAILRRSPRITTRVMDAKVEGVRLEELGAVELEGATGAPTEEPLPPLTVR